MSDLARDLLTQYYGLGAETSGKKFLSIHQSVENVKREEEKQVTEQTSLTTNEENVSENETQNENDESRKLSVASDSYPRPSRVLDDIEDAYEAGENFDLLDIDFGPNILCNTLENVPCSTPSDEPPTNFQSDGIQVKVEDLEIGETNDAKDANENDLSISYIEDTYPDNASEASSATFKKSSRSSRSSIINLTPLVPRRKQPVCNETFVDFSNADLKKFPDGILNNFSQLRMLYLSNNNLMELPGEVFSTLRRLEWLDVRNNQLSSLPASIKGHVYLETILLQGNKIENLPLELCTLQNLRVLQVTQNPLITPPKDVVASGCASILEYLRIEWNNAHPEERIEPKENKIEPKLSTILCYQSPRKNKKRIASLKDTIRDRNTSVTEKRKSYKPSNRYEGKGGNMSMQYRLLWFSKLKEIFAKQAAILQRVKDENVLKEWRRDRRSYSKAMEKAMKRNEDDIPFGFDVEEYASIFKYNSKLRNSGSKRKDKRKLYVPPRDINKKINELLESLNKLEINTTNETTPRTKQSLFKNEIEKILQFQSEIQNLRKYNDVATVPSKN